MTWEVECQNAFLPSLSFQVYKIREPSVVSGVLVSMVVPLKLADNTFRANPSLMLSATSIAVEFFSNSFTEPSGSVILIIPNFFRTANIYDYPTTYNRKVQIIFN
jgi:hypothetical protein